MTSATTRYLTFRAAGRLQVLPADVVREIVKLPRTTRVPHAPASMVGLANVRGAALPILSVAALQGNAISTGDRVLVLDRAHPVGLLVDEVREIVDTKGRTRALDVEALVGQAFRQAPSRAAPARARMASNVGASVERNMLGMLSFVVGQQEFALPLYQVVEVIALPPTISPLPGADQAVVGTIEHRGDLLPILALAHLLGLGDRSEAPSRIVIATLKGHRIGLTVDSMRSVLQIDEACIDPVPTVIARRASEARIQAIARLEEGRRLVSILTADRLFDETQMTHLVERRQHRTKGEEDMVAEATEPFLIFQLGTQSFGLPAAAVEEVVRLPDALTRLPRAPAFVEGVINLRGRAIPVIDQRRRFGEHAPLDLRRRAIVVRLGSLQAAFVVDEVTQIHRIASADIAAAPDISDETRIFDRTAMMADGSIVLLIEPGELIDGTERDLLTALRIDPASA